MNESLEKQPSNRKLNQKRKFSFGSGRRRNQLQDKKINIRVSLSVETFKRVDNLAKRLDCSLSSAVERLIRTQESESIEPTREVNWDEYKAKRQFYQLTDVLDASFRRRGRKA
jgi:macrodomain Ter protein organizer (MatP/YcbG family)